MAHAIIFTLQRFGHLIVMDTMIHGINTWLWPYMVIAMYNGLNKVCITCKTIMLAEPNLAYNFLVQFLFENTPAFQPEEVLVVSDDQFFTQKED